MVVNKVTDAAFSPYGRVIEGLDTAQLVEKMQEMPLPEGVVYEPSVEQLEELPIFTVLKEQIFGELPIQVGYCNGHNQKLNALEYHRSSEINIGATDMIVLLGKQQDIIPEFTYDTSLVEAFLIPKGTVVEFYATTLHYAPCHVEESGFRGVVVLPKDTNLPLAQSYAGGEDGHLTAKNKWLLGHPEGGLDEGAPMGLIGENICLS